MIPVNELIRGYNLYADEYNKKAIDVLKSGWYILGKECEAFEEEFANALGGNCYCAGVDNGLNAISIGVHAYGIGPGDEVIMQGNGYIATTLGITQNGATPVFVDNDEYYNIDPSKIEAAITPKTKAVLVTHLYGQVTGMDQVKQICEKHGLLLFEDCAHAHLATYKGEYAGLFGDAGFFSFYPTKNLGAFGDGGGIVSRKKDFIDKVKTLRNYGADRRYHNIIPGYNSRLDEIQAGLLRIKLSHMNELIENRRAIAECYNKGIHNPLVRLPLVHSDSEVIWYQYVVNVDDQSGFCDYLSKNGVSNGVMFPTPPYLQPAMSYLGLGEGTCPVSEKACKTVVSLPMMDCMATEEIETVIKVVNNYEG